LYRVYGARFSAPKPPSNTDLWSRNYGSVLGNDLSLKRENFAAIGIHEHLHPVNVIVIIRIGVSISSGERVVAKGFDADEIFEAPGGCGDRIRRIAIVQRFVDPEVMSIAMDVSHWLPEGFYLVPKGAQEIPVAIDDACGNRRHELQGFR